MTPADRSIARTVSAEQEARVRAIVEEAILERVPRRARQQFVSSLASILAAPVALVAYRGDVWVGQGAAGLTVPLPGPSDPAWLTLQRLLQQESDARALWSVGGVHFTVIPVGPLAGGAAENGGALLIEGDWRRATGALEHIARASVRGIQRRSAARRRLAMQIHRFTRALAKTGTVQDVGTVILRYVVKAVPSRFAAFAVPTEEGILQIVATHGYPVELVRDVRIAPGDGVIGRVFDRRATGRTHFWHCR